VKKYASEHSTKYEELTFVAFIDTIEKTGENFLSVEESFRNS
jgi:hypothetical protein